MSGRSFEAPWVASVRTTADRLDAELKRIPDCTSPDYQIVANAIARARSMADQPSLEVHGHLRAGRRLWRRFGSWWTGNEVDQAWAALHMAAEALLAIESADDVRSQVGDMAASLVSALTADDLRVKDYMTTLEELANPSKKITSTDRAQLRAIRQACDSSADGGHADARAYRNTLMLVGSLLSIVLVVIGIITVFNPSFRSAFAGHPVGRWYVVELELVASLAGLAGAVLALKSYVGFQYTYGLPFVQAFLKGSTGAATGLFGVLFVQAGIISFVKTQSGGSIFAVAVIFGYSQVLFTRLVDKQANKVLQSASSHNDPATVATPPPGTTPSLLTTQRPGEAQAKLPAVNSRDTPEMTELRELPSLLLRPQTSRDQAVLRIGIQGNWNADDFAWMFQTLASAYSRFSALSLLTEGPYAIAYGRALTEHQDRTPELVARLIDTARLTHGALSVGTVEYASPGGAELLGGLNPLKPIADIVTTAKHERTARLKNETEERIENRRLDQEDQRIDLQRIQQNRDFFLKLLEASKDLDPEVQRSLLTQPMNELASLGGDSRIASVEVIELPEHASDAQRAADE